jgi:hypothetical protein
MEKSTSYLLLFTMSFRQGSRVDAGTIGPHPGTRHGTLDNPLINKTVTVYYYFVSLIADLRQHKNNLEVKIWKI